MDDGQMIPTTHSTARLEKRIPSTIAVHLIKHGNMSGLETTFTEDVSSRGARVASFRSWRPSEVLVLELLPGDFRAVARVTYCQEQSKGFVIGLEFLEPSGRWVVDTPVASGKPLQG
jgi:hypothetical protein